MTLEEQVRRMLGEAVAAEPQPVRPPLDRVLRRRRRRPVRAAVVATALLLVAAVAVVGIRGLGDKPALPAIPSTPSVPPGPPGWKLFQNRTYNLQFHYPPDWVVSERGGFVVAPRSPGGQAGPFFLSVGLSLDYYQFVIQNGTEVTPGTLPGAGRSSASTTPRRAPATSPTRSTGAGLASALRSAARTRSSPTSRRPTRRCWTATARSPGGSSPP